MFLGSFLIMALTRCINIDWLEVYSIESSIGYPHDADFFRRAGYYVQERPYGTPLYKEMFTLYGSDNLPLIEIRRNPKSANTSTSKGILDPYGCHVRLCNRTCYMEDAAGIMQQFLERYMFEYSRISRIDICLDFEKFDSGDNPQVFLDRYVKRKYSKLNQANISLHGLDRWDGRYWNSCKWGAPTSMVTTKLYDKTLELKEVGDKPYIRQAWFAAGLIDDWYLCTKVNRQGIEYTPKIWRLEYSIKSSTKNWFVVENPYGVKPKLRSIKHTLDNYHTRAQMLDVFWSLTSHYFHFKIVTYKEQSERLVGHALTAVAVDNKHDLAPAFDDRQMQRKDRCPDKILFRHKEPAVFYKLAHIATSETTTEKPSHLLQLLYDYREKSFRVETNRACEILIEDLETKLRSHDHMHWSRDELTILRQLIAKRIKNSDAPLTEDYNTMRELMQMEDAIFGEIK